MGKGRWKDERRITFHTIRAGQPRPYADHHLAGEVRAEWHPLGKDVDHESWAPNEGLSELKIKALAKAYWGWVEKPTNPFEPRLTSFSRIGPGVWRVETKAAYTG